MRQAAAAVLALVALACIPASAGAVAEGSGSPPMQWLDIDLAGSNGYSIHVSVNPRRHLILQVSKEGVELEYMTRDVLPDADRVKAKLVGFGTVSVRFHRRGAVRHPSLPGCEGKRPTVQPGVVRGTIKFVGEREYTQVKVREAEAAIEEPKSWLCRYAAKFEPRPGQSDWISKFSTEEEGFYFLARKYRPGVIEGGEVIYLAETGETFKRTAGRPPLTIFRDVSVPASASTFRDAHPERLTLSPPPPFIGTGTLTRTAESVFAWGGDLAVQFPGIDPIPLAGPGLGSDYCLRETGCIRQVEYQR
jgi:hypothetical protein